MDEDYAEDEHKEIYANFGLAIYHAQCLEHGVINALVFLDLIPNQRNKVASQAEWEKMVDSFMDSRFELTLGRLLKALAEVTAVPAKLQEELTAALRKRNWLVHHYFRERVDLFLTRAGRGSMLQELFEVQTLLVTVDEALEEVVRPVREKLGLTDAVLSSAVAKLRAELSA